MIEFEDQILAIAKLAGCQQMDRLQEVLRQCAAQRRLVDRRKSSMRISLRRGFLLLQGVADAVGMRWWDSVIHPAEAEALRAPFPAELASRYEKLLPVAVEDGEFILATWDPF